MKRVFLRVLGALCIIFGAIVIGWIIYNLFFGITASAQESSRFLQPVVQGIVLLFCWVQIIRVGRIWIQGKTIKEYTQDKGTVLKERQGGQ